MQHFQEIKFILSTRIQVARNRPNKSCVIFLFRKKYYSLTAMTDNLNKRLNMPCSWKEDDFVNASILPNVVCKLNKTPTGILMSHDTLLLKCIRSSKKILKEIKVEEL